MVGAFQFAFQKLIHVRVAGRKFAEAEFGCTTVDVAPDGSMVVRRLHASDGAEVYRFEIAAAG